MAVTEAQRRAIKMIESNGGNYKARGPKVAKGRYAGERAMGAYQIMPGNLPQWSQAALGRQVSEAEFMASPPIQDQIFNHQFGASLKKYGNSRDAASAWHSGGSLAQAKARGASDGYSTTEDYVNNFSAYETGKKPVNARASQGGLGDSGPADPSSPLDPTAPALDPRAARMQAFREGLDKLEALRQQALAQGGLGLSQTPQMQNIGRSAINAPVMRSNTIAQPIMVEPSYNSY
jgi:hypothetical protein